MIALTYAVQVLSALAVIVCLILAIAAAERRRYLLLAMFVLLLFFQLANTGIWGMIREDWIELRRLQRGRSTVV